MSVLSLLHHQTAGTAQDLAWQLEEANAETIMVLSTDPEHRETVKPPHLEHLIPCDDNSLLIVARHLITARGRSLCCVPRSLRLQLEESFLLDRML